MHDDAKQARRVRRRSFGATSKCNDSSWRLKGRSRGLSKRVNQPVGSPVGRREASAIAFLNLPDGCMRLAGRYPDQLPTGDNVSQVVSHNVRNPFPNHGKRPGVMRGTGAASKRGGHKRLAISTNGKHKLAAVNHKLESPFFSGGGPPEPMGKQIALRADDRNTESTASQLPPPAIEQ